MAFKQRQSPPSPVVAKEPVERGPSPVDRLSSHVTERLGTLIDEFTTARNALKKSQTIGEKGSATRTYLDARNALLYGVLHVEATPDPRPELYEMFITKEQEELKLDIDVTLSLLEEPFIARAFRTQLERDAPTASRELVLSLTDTPDVRFEGIGNEKFMETFVAARDAYLRELHASYQIFQGYVANNPDDTLTFAEGGKLRRLEHAYRLKRGAFITSAREAGVIEPVLEGYVRQEDAYAEALRQAPLSEKKRDIITEAKEHSRTSSKFRRFLLATFAAFGMWAVTSEPIQNPEWTPSYEDEDGRERERARSQEQYERIDRFEIGPDANTNVIGAFEDMLTRSGVSWVPELRNYARALAKQGQLWKGTNVPLTEPTDNEMAEALAVHLGFLRYVPSETGDGAYVPESATVTPGNAFEIGEDGIITFRTGPDSNLLILERREDGTFRINEFIMP